MTPEGRVKADVKKMLEVYKAYAFMPATHGYGRSGVADFVCCHKGRFIAIECKAGAGRMTALQEREAQRVRDAGGIFVLVDDTPQTLVYLEGVLNGSK